MKNGMKDIMVDIETMGDGPRSAIVSIGAVNFDVETGKIGKTISGNISLKSCMETGLEASPDTILWWMDQPKKVRTWMKYPSHIISVLNDFRKFVDVARNLNKHNDIRMWANPPQFDLVILGNAYKATFVLEKPWHYREERDFRTLKYLYDGKIPEFKIDGPKHDALHDAIYQAKVCSYIYRNLKGKK